MKIIKNTSVYIRIHPVFSYAHNQANGGYQCFLGYQNGKPTVGEDFAEILVFMGHL